MMTSRRFSFSLILVAALAAAAQAREPQVGSRIGGGRGVDVYSISHPDHPKHTIMKIVRSEVWRGKRLYVRDATMLKAHADKVVSATQALHGDAKDGEWFKKIVPSAVHDKGLPGWLLQQPRQGVALSQLRGGAQTEARAQMAKAIKSARKIVGKDVNEAEDNFLFDQSGNLTGWVSVIAAPKGKAMPYERLSETTMGPGINSEVFKVKNLDASDKQSWVVKVMQPIASGRAPGFAPLPALSELSDSIVTMTKVVQGDRVLKRYGKVFPDAFSPAPGIVIQEEVKGGVSYDRLSGSARQRADGDWATVRARLQHLFPGQLITAARQRDRHVGHAADGSILGAFDPLVDSAGKYPGGVRPKLTINKD
jgi:hypothetical protein